jgi:hypothetical protein
MTQAVCAEKIGYGSRAGMQVSVVSKSGLDTRRAIIRTKHTREDAVAFCREYIGKVTPECISKELEAGPGPSNKITANCITREFTDFFGERYRLAGLSPQDDRSARYRLVQLSSGEEADGSSASGYSTNMAIFEALCPKRAPSSSTWYRPIRFSKPRPPSTLPNVPGQLPTDLKGFPF